MPHWDWDDAHVASFDFETSGTKPEHALQPWRIPQGGAWGTSLVWLWPDAGKLMHGGGLLYPLERPDQDLTRNLIEAMLEWAHAGKRRLWGWNVKFDISVILAYGINPQLVREIKWGDGMLLWRHLEIEPEYDDGPRRSYGLKAFVKQFLPMHAGYEAEIDFHDPDPAVRARLHEYNIKDCAFTLMGCKALWKKLEPRQRQAAMIEADCLPHVAEANVEGLLIDTILAQDVAIRQAEIAAARLASLAPYGVTEKIVRSPQQMEKLLFDDWGLPVHKMNPPNKKGTQTRSTDKETLFELAFKDPRARELREYREALNNVVKFCEKPMIAARYNGTGRAYPEAIVFGTYTGRMTYSSKQTKRNQVDE
jgi:DNA polymerase I-like protein with 3'-5' exonuclease and polymerase domains